MPARLEINDDKAEKRDRRKSAQLDRDRRRQSSLIIPPSLQPELSRQSIGPLKVIEILPPIAQQQPSVEEINRNYDEWMKIAADNKINTNNSWNVQLIDYFHELNLMRDGDSINFQKASCTLDGCVKVYSTRVDAVASETNRLLSGLADKGQKNREAESETDEANEDRDENAKKPVKKRSRGGATIEKNPASLNVKKFDLEFSVDPLFKKTCAEFDESGAGGLLLNHLSIYGNGRIVLDASDIDATSKAPRADDNIETEPISEPIDISSLLELFGSSLSTIKERTVCPSLSAFKLNDPSTTINTDGRPIIIRDDDDDASNLTAPDLSGSDAAGDDDVIGGDQNTVGDEDDIEVFEADHGFDDYMYDDNYDEPNFTQDSTTAVPQSAQPAVKKGTAQFAASLDLTDKDMYSYIDTAAVKDWAPLHWKVHRPASAKRITPAGTAAAKPRKVKEPFYIDFMAPPVDQAVLFARDARSSTLPMKKKNAVLENYLLPEDIHYSFDNLRSLFLKPKMKLTLSGTAVLAQNTNDNIESFAGAYDDKDAGFDDDYQGPDVDYGNNDDNNHVGIESTQDSAAFGDVDSTKISRVRSEAINYSKKAKRVDIKTLKDKIWDDLSLEPKEEHKFTDIIDNVKKTYPPQMAQDISVSFYFICLLHLANEKNLKVESSPALDQLKISQ